MEFKKQIIYSNELYCKMESWELHSLLKNQQLLIQFTKLLNVNPEYVNEINYKLECLWFEVHRRYYKRCLIEMHSIFNVKRWLVDVDNNRRCECCNLEYYEFTADLLRIERGVQQCSESLIKLLTNNVSVKRNVLDSAGIDSEPAIPSVSALPSASLSSANNIDSEVYIPYSHTIEKKPSALSGLTANKTSHSGFISSSDFSSRPSKGCKGPRERTETAILPAPTPKSILKSSRTNYTVFENLPKRRRRYVTFNLECNSSYPIQYNYDPPNQGEFSGTAENSTRERNLQQFTSEPSCSFTGKHFK